MLWCFLVLMAMLPLAALVLLHYHRKRVRDIERGICVKCGYNVRDLTSPRCPECGCATEA